MNETHSGEHQTLQILHKRAVVLHLWIKIKWREGEFSSCSQVIDESRHEAKECDSSCRKHSQHNLVQFRIHAISLAIACGTDWVKVMVRSVKESKTCKSDYIELVQAQAPPLFSIWAAMSSIGQCACRL